MKQLPFEIFFNIFPFLHQEQKLECMLVCRSWRNAIQDSFMLDTVRITSIAGLENLMEKVKQEPVLGTYIERLMIDTYSEESQLLPEFLALLPNLRVLLMTETTKFQFLTEEPHASFLPHLNYISDTAKYPMAMYLLHTGLFSNLTSLSVKGMDNFFFGDLQNVPNLKNLTFYGNHLYFGQLELLHDIIPSLEQLSLLRFRFYSSSFNPDIENVKAAVSMTKFHFEGNVGRGRVHDEEIYFLQYIKKKYTNLTDFRYDRQYGRADDSDDPYEPFRESVSEGLGSKITTLYTGNIFRRNNVFSMLDRMGCHVTKLVLEGVSEDTIITLMPQSDQINSLQSLYIKGTELGSFEWLKSLKCLKKLKMIGTYNYSPDVDLNKMLESCPASLRSLSFDKVNVYPSSEDTLSANQITSLSLSDCYLSDNIDTFISQSFPVLTKLKFVLCCLHRKTLCLPTLNLSYLKIYDAFRSDDRGVLIITHCNGERRWHTTTGNLIRSKLPKAISAFDVAFYPALKSYPADQINQVPFLTLECNSLQYLFFHE